MALVCICICMRCMNLGRYMYIYNYINKYDVDQKIEIYIVDLSKLVIYM